MSSPKYSSPLAEALADDDIAFSSPGALRALPIGSSWPPRPETFSPSPYEKAEKRRSKRLPGEKDPQPAFRLPTPQSQQAEVTSPGLSRRPDASMGGSKQFSPSLKRHQSSEDSGPSRNDDAVAIRSPTEESSRIVADPSRRHSAAVEKSKQLSPALKSQKRKVDGMAIGSYSQSPEQGLALLDAQLDAQLAPKEGGEGKKNMESIKTQSTSNLDLNHLRPRHPGPSWPDFNPAPSSPSSSGSWVTARGEESQQAEWGLEEGKSGKEEAKRGMEVGEGGLEAPEVIMEEVEGLLWYLIAEQ